MALNIKNAKTERLARELAAETGEGLTEVLTRALEQELAAIRLRKRPEVEDVQRVLREYRRLLVLDARSPAEVLDDMYDEAGLPK